MTRILFIIDSLWGGGGAEHALLRLIESLPSDRYQCRVLTFHSDETAQPFFDQFPCPVDHWQMVSLYHPSIVPLSWRILRLVRKQKIDIVHTFFPASDLWAGPVAKLSGARFLISSRRDMGILRKRWHNPFYRWWGGFYDEVHAVSEQVRQYTIATDGIDPARVRTVYNGIDPKYGSEIVEQAPTPDDRPVVTVVANIRRVKGIDTFLEAAAHVQRLFPHTQFRIVGGFGVNLEERAYNEQMFELQRTLRLQNSVQFLGPRLDVAPLLKSSDVFVLPSRSEGFSNALLEAMICGLPCVATTAGGNPELIVDGVTGFLVPPEDPAALAARIIEVLKDRAKSKALGQQGRERALANFTSSVMASKVMASYEKISARKS